MSKKVAELSKLLSRIHCSETATILPEFIEQATEDDQTPTEFLMTLLTYEIRRREEKAMIRRMKQATVPYHRTLDEFILEEQPSLSKKNFNKLKELTWVEQMYNVVLLGPTGTGKTSLSVGLGISAV